MRQNHLFAKKILPLVLLLIFCISSTCMAANLNNHPVVGIVPFHDNGLISKEFSREEMKDVVDFAYNALSESDRFELVERTRQRDILNEYSFDMSGLVDEDTCAAIGSQLGAQYLLLGSINGLTTRHSETTVVGAGTKRAQVTATVSMRLVDVETGRVVAASMGRSKKNNTLVKAPLGLIRIGTDEVDKQQALDALESAIEDAVNGPRGLIARMDGKASGSKTHR
ncbi:CsgG/HfaB family protein [Mitsuokella sp.]|uniref:CsgG/HfaB family protein n=1 Tax=Mitsuokella sp. TaxID=2049034 RepID=UPI003D7D5116